MNAEVRFRTSTTTWRVRVRPEYVRPILVVMADPYERHYEYLRPEQARRVAHELLKAADEADPLT